MKATLEDATKVLTKTEVKKGLGSRTKKVSNKKKTASKKKTAKKATKKPATKAN